MTTQMEFVSHYAPGRIADLGFRMAVPKDWQVPELPAEDVDFSDPTKFVPLMVAVAPYAAIALTVCARPAYENGAVSDWAAHRTPRWPVGGWSWGRTTARYQHE